MFKSVVLRENPLNADVALTNLPAGLVLWLLLLYCRKISVLPDTACKNFCAIGLMVESTFSASIVFLLVVMSPQHNKSL